ncbi:response regulator [Lysinibacillus sp. SGAir0095]|uniref:response regulator n=1 Tax=Lysinibacillus sp. SGAir0095 TaxID=2070463 RepID=UPI0010CCD9A0|nr:response regulator [Lysinibacillus sp. SGAir0095]QCR32906.1 response regulator [Lysinibacillus sp. SGAir0095]
MDTIKVILVEDDPMVREVNRQFIERVQGFKVISMCSNGVEGYNQIEELSPHLVIMDIFMPEQDGLITLRKIRNANLPVDVITVTAANDMQTIQQILHLGVYDYIMKPFTFERIQQTLFNYYNFKLKTFEVQDITQKELDEMIRPYRELEESMGNEPTLLTELPKGFNRTTLDKVLHFVKASRDGVSADEVAAAIGVARVTARRYLDFLEKQNFINVDVHYGGIGRPINHYFV